MGMRQPPSPQGSPQGPPDGSSPSPQSPPSQDPAQGGISKLVSGIYSQLTQLMDALSQASQSQPDVVSPDDIQELSGIVQAYQKFVTENLGSAPGAGKAKPPVSAGAGQVSPQQGSQPSSNVKQVQY